MERTEINVRNAAPIAAAGFLAGLGAGGALGYLLCRRSMRKKMDEWIASEIRAVKEHYQNRAAATTPESGDGSEWLPAVGREGPVDEPEPFDPRLEGVEGGGDDEEDAAVDVAEPPPSVAFVPVNRDASKPYAISLEEFGDQQEGWQQLTITYYALDKVLVDDKDQPIRDVQGTTGHLDALGFGGISEDPHIRYVRNHKLEIDFEIVLDARSYADVILNYGNPNRGIKEE